jgi:hypothetical protein
MDDDGPPTRRRRPALGTATAVAVVCLAAAVAVVRLADGATAPAPGPTAAAAPGVPRRPLRATSALELPAAPAPGWLPGTSAFTADRAVDDPLVLAAVRDSLAGLGITAEAPAIAWYLGRVRGIDAFLATAGEHVCGLSYLAASGALRGHRCTSRRALDDAPLSIGAEDAAGNAVRAFVLRDDAASVALADRDGRLHPAPVRDDVALGWVRGPATAFAVAYADGTIVRTPLARGAADEGG